MAVPLNNKVALVTGANSGVGLELTKRLLTEGSQVIALIRSDFAADEPQITQARQQGRLRVYRADLSNFVSLKQALDAIKANESHVDILFNNAAAAIGGIHQSPQGHEMHFEVNTVVPYIVAMELKPLLERGTFKTIINTSSNALLFIKKFDLNVLEHPTTYRPIIGPYGASKLGLSLWTQALAPQLKANGIEIRSVNPGANKTKMTRSDHFPLLMRPLRQLFFTHPSVGADKVYQVAFGSWQGSTGVFVNNGKAAAIGFQQLANAVLNEVDTIYHQAFLGQTVNARSA